LGQQRPLLRHGRSPRPGLRPHVEQADELTFADVLASDLASRATVDTHGARWSNHEPRASPSTLAPRTGWAMGNAGIIRELLRYARIHDGQDPDYAIAWPDHPPTTPRQPPEPG